MTTVIKRCNIPCKYNQDPELWTACSLNEIEIDSDGKCGDYEKYDEECV